jgi:hypothetical protein
VHRQRERLHLAGFEQVLLVDRCQLGAAGGDEAADEFCTGHVG